MKFTPSIFPQKYFENIFLRNSLTEFFIEKIELNFIKFEFHLRNTYFYSSVVTRSYHFFASHFLTLFRNVKPVC